MSNQNVSQITTPIGRLVSGDCYDPQTKDSDGNPLLVKHGVNAGEPRVNFYLGIAIAKDGRPWEQTEWGFEMMKIARMDFPAMFDANGTLLPGRQFSFKVTDGDSTIPNTKGRKPCDAEGYPGNWILHWGNGFPPKCVDATGDNVIPEGQIKCGHYIQIMGYIKGNGSAQQSGIYLNTKIVAHAGFGPEIMKGPDASDVGFGGALPPGASATPVGGMAQQQQAGGSPPPPGAQQQAPVNNPPPQVDKWIYNNAEYTREEILSWAGWNESHIATLQKVVPAAPVQQAVTTPAAPVTPATDLVTPGGGNPPPQLPGAGGNPPPPGAQQQAPVEKWIYNNVAYTREEILSWAGWNEAHLATLRKA